MATETLQDPRLDTLQAIELAEGVEIKLRLAGPLLRGGALALDLALQVSVLLVLAFIFGLAAGFVGTNSGEGLFLLTWFFIWWWYPVFFEAGKWGATPGKKMLGLRVVQKSGSPITFAQSLLRNFLKYGDGMPYIGFGVAGIPTFGFGLATMLATERFQRLGDLAAATVVVYDKPPREMAPPPPFREIDSAQPMVALSPDEIRALVAFRERANGWSADRRVEVADHLRQISGQSGAAGLKQVLALAYWLENRA